MWLVGTVDTVTGTTVVEPCGLRLRCVDGFVFASKSVVCNGLSLSLSVDDMGDPGGGRDEKNIR